MGAFDPELWRTRAWSRYQRTLVKDPNKSTPVGLRSVWERDVVAIESLTTLVSWCLDRGIDVNFCKHEGGIYYPENKRIKINGRLQPEKQVFFLLHECGHHLIGDKEKHERFGMGYSQDDVSVKRTFHHRCDIVDEEFEAWHRGFKLAKRLRLTIDKERFDRTRAKMLKTYFKWSLRIDGYGKDDDEEAVA